MQRSGTMAVSVLLLAGAGNVFAQPPLPSRASEEVEPVTDKELRLPVDERTAAEIDRFIPLLGSPDFVERETATNKLITIGATAFAKLQQAYHQTDDLEVLLRIDRIVHIGYLIHHVFGKTGFLGIRRSSRYPGHNEDPRIPQGHFGIQLAMVLPDTGAERAGLRKGDIIIALDGGPLHGSHIQAFAKFSEEIRNRGPGGQLTLTVLRGPSTMEIQATLGPVPRETFNQVAGVAELVQNTNRRFQIWWVEYFRKNPPASPGDTEP